MRKTRGSRRLSGGKRRGARQRFVAGFTLFALALAAAIIFAGRLSPQLTVASNGDLPQTTMAQTSPTVPAAAAGRTVYPYSIIARGACSFGTRYAASLHRRRCARRHASSFSGTSAARRGRWDLVATAW